MFGGLIAHGLFDALIWQLVAAAVLVVFVRPATGIVALLGFDRRWAERAVISAYGLRGIGTLYSLAYGLNNAAFQNPDAVWALARLTIRLSIVLPGFSATSVVEQRLGEENPTDEWEEAPYEHV